jgi:hypothetical protein
VVTANQDPNGFSSRRHSAAFLDCCVRTLDKLPIKKYRIGKRVFYRRSDLVEFMSRHEELPTICNLDADANPLASLLRDVARTMPRKQGA